MLYIAITVSLTIEVVISASTTAYQYQLYKPSCDDAKNLTLSCFEEETVMLHSSAAAIHGNLDKLCDPLISEQTCYLCRRFNKTRSCLNVLIESCDYAEIYQFMWSQKLPYLGTVSSFCNTGNALNEIYDNRECYNGITANLRKCFNVLKDRNCSTVSSGFTCSTKISQAYCASLFNDREEHKKLSALYLRTLEPTIDLQNCTIDSEIAIAKIYPEYLHRWKMTSIQPLHIQLEIQTYTSTMNTSTAAAQTISLDLNLTILTFLLLLITCTQH